ncbi:MAG: phage holin family protein, partial [Methanobacterium sp.]
MGNYGIEYNKFRFYWIWRTLLLWVGASLGFILIANLDIGLTINAWDKAFIVVGVVGILNAILWPLLSRILLPFIVVTVGVGTLLINGTLIWLASDIIPGITIEGAALILTPIAMAAISMILITLSSIDDEASWYYEISAAAKKVDKKNIEDKPGFVFMEIDGLAENILLEAVEKGYMPSLKRWIEDGTHEVTGWETDLSSQTGASQAGILHGNNEDVVAFRWVEKSNDNKFMVSTGLSDAPIIEGRVSNGDGLLAVNGASRANLFSGDAEDVIFTFSKLKSIGGFYSI